MDGLVSKSHEHLGYGALQFPRLSRTYGVTDVRLDEELYHRDLAV
jgi:hypothetical protein